MRALRTLSRRRPRRDGRRQEALRRHRAAALIAVLATAIAGGGALGATAKPKPPPKPPKPKLELLTGTEQGALDRKQIKVGVFSKRGDRARVEARLVVDGFPDDFIFNLADSAKIKNREGVAHLPLSARQLEVLDFAIKSCRGASLSISARVGKRTGHLNAALKLPADC